MRLHDVLVFVGLVGLGGMFVLPVIVYRWGKAHRPRRMAMITGAAFGLVVSPASFGVYAAGMYLPVIGIVPVLIGLPLTLLHSPAGYYAAIGLGFIAPARVVVGSQH